MTLRSDDSYFYRVPVVVMLLRPSRTIITGYDTFTTLFDTTSRLIDDDDANAATTTTSPVANFFYLPIL